MVCNEDNRSAEFDMVVLTIPAPQLLHINMEPQIPQEVSLICHSAKFNVNTDKEQEALKNLYFFSYLL